MAIDRFVSDYLIPPGQYLSEALEDRDVTLGQLAESMGRPLEFVNEIIQDKREITEETASELQAALSIPAHFWLNIQVTYRIGVEREKAATHGAGHGDLKSSALRI